MLKKLVLSAALVLAASGAFAEERIEAIPGVIQNQIEAFRADDFATAFTFASPTIKRLFGDSENFGRMVRQGYPMVWRPAEVQFLGQETRGGAVYQNVLIVDGNGVPHGLEYMMIETPDGWQINGVRFVAPPAVGA